MSTPREPLWRVMDRAAYPMPLPQRHSYRAAEIRAVADWLVPEEHDRPLGPRQGERMELRQRLLAEADRAERGEAHP